MPAQPFIGQIMVFAGNFAPQGWAQCDGSLLPISQYDALFSLIGTTYGGDGQTTFALPDLRSRLPIHQGQGAGPEQLQSWRKRRRRGCHAADHPDCRCIPTRPWAIPTPGTSTDPAGGVWASGPTSTYIAGASADTNMNPTSISGSGGGQPHDNMLPFLTLNFCMRSREYIPHKARR